MSLLLDDPMSVDGGMQDIQAIQDLGGMEVLGAMEGMAGMESAMALDDVDLFGDPVLEDTLAAMPPRTRKRLRQRLDELRTRGCSQGIAWSRQGTIASIARDAMSIDLRSVQCNPDTAEWELSEPASWSPSSRPPANPSTAASLPSSSAPFVHLAWAPTLTPDLAVLDAHGRNTVLSFSLANNQPYPVRRWETDVVDDLHAVVGCYWLPLGTAQNKQVRHASLFPQSGRLGPRAPNNTG
jgi:mediator of RNA polymerase II transcription subunit 16